MSVRPLRVLVAALLAAAAVLVPAAPALAAPTFKVPFPCGQSWSGQTRTNHSPAYAVDFNRTDDLGDPVVASAPGTVDVVTDLGGTSYGKYVRINHGGGYTTYYAHLNGVQRLRRASRSGTAQVIGYVGTHRRLDRPAPALRAAPQRQRRPGPVQRHAGALLGHQHLHQRQRLLGRHRLRHRQHRRLAADRPLRPRHRLRRGRHGRRRRRGSRSTARPPARRSPARTARATSGTGSAPAGTSPTRTSTPAHDGFIPGVPRC